MSAGIADSFDAPIWNAILADAQRRMPGYKVVEKDASWLSWFAPKFASTFGLTTYMPKAAIAAKRWPLLGHEQLHGWDYLANRAGWIISYAFPQWLATGMTGAFGAPASLWYLLFLLAAVFIFMPSPMRTHWERRGYRMTIVLSAMKYGEAYVQSADFIATIVGEFTKGTYLWMDPFATTVEGWVRDDVRRGLAIVRGEYDDPVYSSMVKIVRDVVTSQAPTGS